MDLPLRRAHCFLLKPLRCQTLKKTEDQKAPEINHVQSKSETNMALSNKHVTCQVIVLHSSATLLLQSDASII